jgi:putative alpha-1,2-mannosidase
LNGKNWDSPFLPCKELEHGGTIDFVMGPQPSQWGTRALMP